MIRVAVDDQRNEANSVKVQAFLVTVKSVNDQPTLDEIFPPTRVMTIDEDTGPWTVDLTGISAGGAESQKLTVTASSSNTGLIPTPAVVYTSPDTTGNLSFTPVKNAFGSGEDHGQGERRPDVVLHRLHRDGEPGERCADAERDHPPRGQEERERAVGVSERHHRRAEGERQAVDRDGESPRTRI